MHGMGTSRADVVGGTVSTGMEAMVVADGLVDMMACSSYSDSWPNCAESVARSADVTVIVQQLATKRDV
jgi:hypothetical protein